MGYIIIPLIAAVIINQTFFANKGADAISELLQYHYQQKMVQ